MAGQEEVVEEVELGSPQMLSQRHLVWGGELEVAGFDLHKSAFVQAVVHLVEEVVVVGGVAG